MLSFVQVHKNATDGLVVDSVNWKGGRTRSPQKAFLEFYFVNKA